jgi:DNA-binding response OmpR family regulator
MAGPPDCATSTRVLLVEDDAELRRHLIDYLQHQGFEATGVGGLADARALLGQHRFETVLVDLHLGGENGLDLLRELAIEQGPAVIVVTARGEEADRVVGLELGADDYLVKPFSFRELTARIRTVLRRSTQPRTPVRRRRLAHFDRWTADLVSFKAMDDGEHVVEFTAGELAVLRAFLEHPGRVLWRNELLALTHHDDAQVFPRTIDVLVARLRQKLEAEPRRPSIIRTVRGEGYRFEPPVRWALE